MSWGMGRRAKVLNKLSGSPHRSEGSDGDMQVRQTNAGPKLFAKIGGIWNNTFLSKESDVLSIRDNRGVSRISLSASGDADFHGTLKITGYGGMIDFQGGRDNVILGSSSKKPLENLVNSSDNVSNFAVGNNCMNSTINATQNVAIGEEAMMNMGNDASDDAAAITGNVAIGFGTMRGDSTRARGSNNVLVGWGAGYYWNEDGHATGASHTVAVGYYSGRKNCGNENIYIGSLSGYGHTDGSTGYSNVGIGNSSLTDIKAGYANVCVGHSSGKEIDDGVTNTCIGPNAGDNITTGDNNICIGSSTRPSAVGGCGQVLIGSNITGTADDTTIIGNTDIILDAAGDITLDAAGTDVNILQADLNIPATNKLYFDGGSDTSIYESTGDTLTIKVGGDSVLILKEEGDNGNTALFKTSCAVFSKVAELFSDDSIIGSGGTDDTHIDFRHTNKISLAVTGNITNLNLIFPAGSGNFTLLLTYDGDHTITNYKVYEFDESAADGNADVLWPGGTKPDNTASGVDILSFFYDSTPGADKCYGVASLAFATP